MYRILIIEDDFSLAEAMKKQIVLGQRSCMRAGLPECAYGFYPVRSAFGAGRYYVAVLQRISLVHRDPKNLTGSDCVYQLGF